MNELCKLGAERLAKLIASREVRSIEVIDAHLARIDEVNPALNAVTATLADTARAAAADVDRALAAGQRLGPLAGVPFTVKENIDVAGTATTWGVAAMAGQMATADAPMVARLREAGAIPIARTNLPDFAFRWDTVSGRAGRTKSPWDPTRTPGGSSGGEAVALATGMTPLGLGNDLGGSMRVPAQMCGIASLRPSRGRVANHAVTQPWPEPLAIQRANCQGPMARHVADLRLALGLISAADPRDPRWVPAPLEAPRAAERLRVAVVRDPAGGGVDPLVRAGIERAASWLSDAGYDVVEAEPPRILEAAQAWFDTMATALGVMWPMMAPVASAEHRAFVEACLAHGAFRPLEPGAELKLWMTTYELGSAWSEFQARYPIILSPVCSEGPWLIGEDISRIEALRAAMRMVLPVNVLGLPSCVVPVGSDGGLPQAVQLIGARFGEQRLLDAADTIEKQAPALTPIEPRATRLA